MSTVDPRVVRAQRQARGGGIRAFLAILAAIVHMGLWTLAGYGFGMIFDSFRLMSINQVGEGWDSPYDDSIPVPFFVGIFVGAFLGFVFTSLVSRFIGRGAGILAPFVTATLGIAIGLTLFIPLWTKPQAYGGLVPFLDGDAAEPWGAGAWISFWLPIWLPALFGVLFLVFLVVTLVAMVRGRRTVARAQHLLHDGRRTQGVVTEARYTGVEINGLPYVAFTVQFRDLAGTDRWVSKRGTFPPTSTPRAGDPAAVWFDPMNPGDQKNILVGLGPDATTPAI
jgi:hypothetical protein